MLKFIYKLIPDWFKISCYKLNNRRPWSRGYFTYKFKYIEKVINNQEMMKRFNNKESLPKKYGYALDERVIEYPWVLSRLSREKDMEILDAGSALNFKKILEFPFLKNKKLTIVSLSPEEECFWKSGVSYVFGDIRNLPFKDNHFDYIICISTLEHIGMDNFLYTKNSKYKEKNIFDFEKAILELKRVLKDEGKLFITVPFGKYQNFGWLQQFNPDFINRILEVFQPKNYQINYYKYTKEGWNISDKDSSEKSEYFNVHATKYFNKESSLGFDADLAAASRAVACIELIK